MVLTEKPPSHSRSGKEKTWQQSLQHHLKYVVGYDWLVAITIAPIAFAVAFCLAVVLPEATQEPWRPPPIAVLCIAGYIFFEVAAFCLERNWSRVSVWRFWSVAAPLAVLQAFLCWRLTKYDVLGCLLFVSLCLGLREFLFEFQALSQYTRKFKLTGGSMQENFMFAFLGGSTYGIAVFLLCGLAGALAHAVIGDGRVIHSVVMLEVLCTLALPLGRYGLRLLLNRAMIASTTASLQDSSELPKLDALVMYADVLFWLTMFLEVTFAFVFLLVPKPLIFFVALAVNLLLDVLFVQTVSDMQRRSQTIDRGTSAPDSGRSDNQDLPYCIERPESIFLVLSNGVPLSNSSEAAPLLSTGTDRSQYPVFCLQALLWWKETMQRIGARRNPEVDNPMSPRISSLLDAQDGLVVGCRSGRKDVFAFLEQAYMIALNTHFLGSTLALVLVVIALPIAKHAGDNNHTEFLMLQHFPAAELALRAISILAFRVLADLIALRILDKNAKGANSQSLDSFTSRSQQTTLTRSHSSESFAISPKPFWECRHDVSTFSSWSFRVLAATCPLFAVIAATL